MSHTHTMKDTDPVFYIDSDSRTIESTYESPVKLVKGDHNSEIFTFEMERYIDEHDLKLCNKVEVHYINIDANNSKNKNYGIYTVTDLTVDPSDDKGILFTWKIPIAATTYAGALSFVVRFECIEGEEILYAWNTTPCNEVSVLDSIYNTDFIEEEYTDVIGEWYNEILSAKNQALNEIGKSGGIVVSRTEPDSDDVNVWVDNSEEEVVMLLEASDCVKMANSIKGTASGEVIRLDDVSPLEHAIKAKVGKNLFDYTKIENTLTYQKFTVAVEPGKAYTVSSDVPKSSAAEIYFNGDYTTENGVWAGHPQTFIATSNEMYLAFQYRDNLQQVMDGNCYVQFEEGSVATDYEPYIDPTTVTVTGCGKNLFNILKAAASNSAKVKDDGTIEVTTYQTSTAVQLAGGHLSHFAPGIKVGNSYTLSAKTTGTDKYIYLNQAKHVWYFGTSVVMTQEMIDSDINLYASGVSTTCVISDFQIELGSKATDPETYTEKTYAPSSDGSVSIDSVSPTTTVFTDTPGVTIKLEYNKDINKVLANLPSGGGGGGSVDIEVDDAVTQYSDNPVSSDAVYNEFVRFSNSYDQIIDEHKIEAVNEANTYTNEKLGDIDTALDSIIEIQNSLIGGDA